MQMVNHMFSGLKVLKNLLVSHHIFWFPTPVNTLLRYENIQRGPVRGIRFPLREWKRIHGGNVGSLGWWNLRTGAAEFYVCPQCR